MKFEDVYSRRTADKLTQEQAAEILGVSVRTVRRWEDRFEADGAEGLYDRRLGKLANNRVPTDTVMEMLTLFDSKYWITRQSISTRNLWNTMASPKATTGYV
ncbi:helix-turn-helix domain-containing protein [Tateyamaria sp.]|uniref:helix-turn-helix domain-containing protein n=1 Tax=Tateyamaria sp. TaxID=1929288 RepID=UPI003B21C8EB